MKTIYLCGPINGCTDSEANDWRSAVKAAFNYGPYEHMKHAFRDPMVRDYRGKEAESYREIVDLDKRDVRESDVILVSYSKPSVGTAMEVFYAWTLGKPVILWCATDAVLSPWLRYHCTAIVHTLEQVVAKIRVMS